MKKLTTLSLFLILFFNVNGQNCNFTYSMSGALNVFTFTPNPNFSPNHYSFSWDFGDGHISTQVSPTHAFNSTGPFYVCYDILDSNSNIVCSSCDTLSTHVPPGCSFNAQQSGTNLTYVFTATPSAGGNIVWDFGDGTTGVSGNTVTHVYTSSGTYNVCMTELDPLTGGILCVSCNHLTVSSPANTCTFTATSNVLIPATYNFSANVPPNSTVTWDFGDGTSGSGMQVSHTYSTTGTFMVCMTAIDANGHFCHYCHPVYTGSSHGNCYFTFAQNSTHLNVFTFTGSAAYPNSNISWDFGDGTTASGTTITHSFSAPGNYNVCMIETDSTGTVICSDCQNVHVSTHSSCNFTWSANPHHSLTIDLQANSSPTATVSWDFGDGNTGTGATASHTYASAGTYNVCVTIMDGGLVCTYCHLVSTGPNTGTCSISYFPDPFIVQGFVFNFQSSGANSTVVWDLGDGSMATGNSVNHTYTANGSYVVCAIERDSSSNIVCQTCVTIQVGGLIGCQASFISSSLGLTSYFIDLSIAGSSGTVYTWDFGDGHTSHTRFPQHTYAAPGTYNACLTITSGICTDTYCSAVVVDTTFNPSGSCTSFFTILQLAPYQVSVINLASGVNLNFVWDFGDGSSATGPYPSHVYSTTGSYNLCLTVSDAHGCVDTYCDTISVDTIGNIFRTISGFTINVYSPQQLTGVNEVIDSKSFLVYPNPFTNQVHVDLQQGVNKITGYRIYSLQGSVILTGAPDGLNGAVNMQSLSSGTYLFEIQLSDGSRAYQSIIKN